MIASESLAKLRDKIRATTKRNRGVSLEQLIEELNQRIDGWYHYYKLTSAINQFRALDAWIRRKLRCYRLKQFKRVKTIAKELMKMNVHHDQAWKTAAARKGWWGKSMLKGMHIAFSNKWFEENGLKSLARTST